MDIYRFDKITVKGHGLGRKLFEFTNNELNVCIPDNIGMVLEVPKENVSDPDELLIRKRTIQFYSRLGVKVLKGVLYISIQIHLLTNPVAELNPILRYVPHAPAAAFGIGSRRR